jgi:hypothetical protein
MGWPVVSCGGFLGALPGPGCPLGRNFDPISGEGIVSAMGLAMKIHGVAPVKRITPSVLQKKSRP